MEKKTSEFDKVFSAWDILVIAFGAMIGWGWVVSTGDWIQKGGVFGAALGFAMGGIMIFFVGLTYAELTAAMPQCGGEHVFSYKAMGPVGSYICTWAIILGYVSVVCFEACALPTIVSNIYPPFNYLLGKEPLYEVAGFKIYLSWLLLAIIVAIIITFINIKGAKTAAKLQTVLTVIIGGAGILLMIASAFRGNVSNLSDQMFIGDIFSEKFASTLSVAVMTPFFFIGFDVIPQAAEEINVPLKKIGKILILSIFLAVAFYSLVIIAVGYVLSSKEIAAQVADQNSLVTAFAMGKAFGWPMMSKVLIIGGMCGIVTSWNSFLLGGSRAMYSMAESYMIPRFFVKLHPKYKTPINALYLIGALSILAPFCGRTMLVWIMDVGNFGCCLAYCMVAMSFLILRKKQPDMPRPYKVKHYKVVGALAVVLSGFMVAMYAIPGTGCSLAPQEWIMAAAWIGLGFIFFFACKAKYKEKFGSHIDVAVDDEDFKALERSNEEVAGEAVASTYVMDEALSNALSTARTDVAEIKKEPKMNFDFCLPTNVLFGSGKIEKVGELLSGYCFLGQNIALINNGKGKSEKLFDKVCELLEKTGFAVERIDDLSNVTEQSVSDMINKKKCKAVVAVGDSYAMKFVKKVISKGKLPVIMVPDFNGLDCVSEKTAAEVVIVDTDYMTADNVSKENIAGAGYTALCGLIETYTSKKAQPISDAISLYAMDLISENLMTAYKKSSGYLAATEKIALALTMAGMAFNIMGSSYIYDMDNAIASIKGTAPGQTIPALAPEIAGRLHRTNHFKFARVARILGGVTAEDLQIKLKTLSANLNLTGSLGKIGVKDADIKLIIEKFVSGTKDGSFDKNELEDVLSSVL